MNTQSYTLIHLLSAAIRNQIPQTNKLLPIDWDAVYEEALAHQVHTILYPIITHLPENSRPSNSLLLTWKNDTFLAATAQIKHIQQITKVLTAFNNKYIPVIPLKGLLLRSYYPSPELRTMGDADLLVKREDFIKAKELLQTLGYHISDTNIRHTSFHFHNYPAIELHHTLTEIEDRKQPSHFTESIWNYTYKTTLEGVPILSLSIDDQFIHLLLHMANHIIRSGFGLRQLCDITLYVEKHMDSMNWDYIRKTIRQCELQQFLASTMTICHQFLNLTIPNDLLIKTDTSYIELFMNDIINAGVYGRKTYTRETSDRITKYIEVDDSSKKMNRLYNLCLYLFPPINKLGVQYSYAKRIPLLLPLAWIHRGITNIKRIDSIFNLREKNIEATAIQRIKLLHWLQLR